MKSLYAALEIGTARTVLAIAETDRNGRLKVTCHAEINSTGVRKSQILDINQAKSSIRSVLHEIEEKQSALGLKVTINNVLLVVSGQHIKADRAEGMVQMNGGKVSQADIDDVINRAHDLPLARGRELLDIIEQDYVVDNLGGIISPKGMSGRVLKLNAIHIHADSNRIQDARSAADLANLEISEPVFAATCAADAVLEEHEKKNGVLTIDLGGGSTGYTVHSDGYLVATNVIGVGSDHINNDIANAFQTQNSQAERLKETESSAMLGQYTTENARVPIVGSSVLMENRTISRRALDTVVNARMKELFTIIREELEERDLLHRLHAGVVLTGGGANLREVDTLAEQILGMPARLGRPIHIDGFEEEEHPWQFAAISGALIYSQRNDDDKSIIDNLLGRLF